MIGRTGKYAQRFGQHYQQRYKVTYSDADTTTLQAPIQRIAEQPNSMVGPSLSAESERVYRAIGTAQVAEETTSPPQSASSGVDVEAVAERVYELFVLDTKRQQERLGKRF